MARVSGASRNPSRANWPRYRAERDTLEQQIAKLAATLPLISQRADDMQTLLKTNAVARAQGA